ncbi:MAG: response regulator transcription factor [Bryobacteraceae bacterium]|nr:response regulator transcription factor [Bryobacteraceae bacterium]
MQSPVSATRLLLIEDDTRLCRLIREYMLGVGYDVTFAHNGVDGLRMALAGQWSAVILDVMLPQMNGFEVLRKLRASSTVPVLMLTGMGDESDRISGLEGGADDYLPKTFSTRELLARLRAVIRRSRMTEVPVGPVAVTVGTLVVSPDTRSATLDGRPVALTPVEFDMLYSLAQAAGRVKTREQLLLESAERDFEAFDRSIDVHISSLRRKLGDDAKSPQFIVTVRGAGYLMRRPEQIL